MNPTEIFKSIYHSKRDDRKNIIDEIIQKISENKLSLLINHDELFLIIDEALTNAMEHGNNWDPEKNVAVNVVKNSKLLHIYIGDDGNGFDINSILKSRKSIKNLKPRGRGIYIIKQFCKPEWNNTGNRIDLQVEIK
jgi:anti-sigma regulatory factor (Ser/Thr protein kinase)